MTILQDCYSMRRGTVFVYRGETLTLQHNNTLERTLRCSVEGSDREVTLRYKPGAQIKVLSRPYRVIRDS